MKIAIVTSTLADNEYLGEFIASTVGADLISIYVDKDRQGTAFGKNQAARNTMYAEYLALVDADDIIDPNFIDRAATYLDEHPRISWVTSWGITTEGNVLKPEVVDYKTCLDRNGPASWALIRSVDFYGMGGYSEDMIHEDWDLWLKLLSAGYEYHVIPEVLYTYRIHPMQKSANSNLVKEGRQQIWKKWGS